MHEYDIQHLIEMNRATRLLHKVHFEKRQIRTLAYLNRYIISATSDLKSKPSKQSARANATTEDRTSNDQEAELVARFDPQTNSMDRRIFYEVTGRQYFDGEFSALDEDSSFVEEDEEDWRRMSQYDPLAPAFQYGLLVDGANEASNEAMLQ